MEFFKDWYLECDNVSHWHYEYLVVVENCEVYGHKFQLGSKRFEQMWIFSVADERICVSII